MGPPSSASTMLVSALTSRILPAPRNSGSTVSTSSLAPPPPPASTVLLTTLVLHVLASLLHSPWLLSLLHPMHARLSSMAATTVWQASLHPPRRSSLTSMSRPTTFLWTPSSATPTSPQSRSRPHSSSSPRLALHALCGACLAPRPTPTMVWLSPTAPASPRLTGVTSSRSSRTPLSTTTSVPSCPPPVRVASMLTTSGTSACATRLSPSCLASLMAPPPSSRSSLTHPPSSTPRMLLLPTPMLLLLPRLRRTSTPLRRPSSRLRLLS